MRAVTLFTGIGGLDLGLRRAGIQIVGQCENDPFCRQVLRRQFPEAWLHDDVRTLTGERIRAGLLGGGIDLLAGGPPCQDISSAAFRAQGIDGPRSGLWREFARILGELRPRFALVENVAALRWRGLGRILGDLALLGYDAEWHSVTASAFGAPHRRDRTFVVAYPSGGHGVCLDWGQAEQTAHGTYPGWEALHSDTPGHPSDADIRRLVEAARRDGADPTLCALDDGIPALVDEYRAIGNSVAPAVAEFIGRCLMKKHNPQELQAIRTGTGC